MKLETSVSVGVSDDLNHETSCTGNDRNVGNEMFTIRFDSGQALVGDGFKFKELQ